MIRVYLTVLINLVVLQVFSQKNEYSNVIAYISNDSILVNELSYITNKRKIKKKYLKKDTLQFSVSIEILRSWKSNFNDSLSEIKKSFADNTFYEISKRDSNLVNLSTDKLSSLRVYFTEIYENKYILGEFVIITRESKYSTYTTTAFYKWRRISFLAILEDQNIKDIIYRKREISNKEIPLPEKNISDFFKYHLSWLWF